MIMKEGAMLTQVDVLDYLIEKGPGRTEVELSAAIHGFGASQQRVNQDCVMLTNAGKVERRGEGGVTDPYRYYPT
jgi:hypothetical protein